MIVGLTGGIGAGKSLVASVFQNLGALIFNSDVCAKQAYFNTLIKEKVISLLGNNAYLNEREINKEFISKKIFTEPDTLNQLNGIIHPYVYDRFNEFASVHTRQFIIYESALLIETGTYKQFDKLVFVTAPIDLRVKRVMKRDGLSEVEVKQRINAQLNDDDKIKLSDFVITNSENEFITTQCTAIYNLLNK